jgi:hypothetical protein
MFVLVLFLSSGSIAGESVRIVPDISTVSAEMQVAASGNAGTDVNLSVPAISLVPIELNATEYMQAQLPVAEYLTAGETSEEGKPLLPVLTTMIAIPDRAGIRLNITHSGYDTFENIAIAPVQSPQPESDPTPLPFIIDNDAYATDAFYPGELAEASDPAIMRDVRLTLLSLYPVQYNPARRELRVYRDLSVSVSYDGEVINPKTTRHRYLSDGFYPIYKSMIPNFEQLLGTVPVRRGGYVIIYKRNLADSLRVDSLVQSVAMWKHQKGYTTRLVPTTEINSNGSPTYLQIQTYLRTAYETWDSPPEYVMVVGDQDGIYMVNDYPYSGSYASDHQYACMEGNDILPEIFVGRMSVVGIADYRRAISKIFKYERNPQMFDSEHWIRGFSIGYTWYETARLTTLWVRQVELQHGFIRVDSIFGQEYNPNVLNYLNNGRSLVQYRGAGDQTGWWGPSFTISNLSQMQNNQKMGVMAILTCGTGDFGVECLGENWLRAGLNPDSLKGGPAYYGVSDHFTHTKWNNPIMMGFFWGLFAENTYHVGAAAVRGKLQQYATFPREINGQVRLYFHTYNMLGDPELEMRTAIPREINVAHAETVAFGLNHFEVAVADRDGAPVEGAFVTLIKTADSNEEVFSAEKTDTGGQALLYFDPTTAGSMKLTVSGQNLIPYITDVDIVADDIAVGSDSVYIDDDNLGYSRGNSDTEATPNEILEMTVAVKNFGTAITASDVRVSLEALDDLATIHIGEADYGDLGPGESRTNFYPFVIHISPTAMLDEVSRIKLNVTDQNSDSWYSLIEIPITAPRFAVTRVTVTDENNRLDQNDTAEVVMTLSNIGRMESEPLTGYVSSADDYATILSDDCTFEAIPIDSSSSNAGMPIVVAAPAEVFDGHSINLMLHLTSASGQKTDVPFEVTVGAASTSDPTGPDAYGYYIYDNSDSSYAPAPGYEWVGIAPAEGGSATRLNFGGQTDDKSVLVNLPFDFVYFGEPHRNMIVSINGFAAFDTFHIDMGGNYWALFFNWPIPDPGNASGQISPFWDDLSFSGSSYGVYTWYDTTNHRFIVEWYHMTNRNTNAIETFEMIVHEPAYHPTMTGDSEILFLYNTISNNDTQENYASVGFEDVTETVGLQYSYDNSYPATAANLSAGRAVKITTNTGRGGIRGSVNLNNGGFNQGVTVGTSTGQRRMTDEAGDYWIKNVPPGMATIRAEIDGYFPVTINDVTVNPDITTGDIDFDMTICPIPANLRATDSLDIMVELTWDAVLHGNLVGYDLYRARWENGEFIKVNSAPIVTTTYMDTSVPDTGAFWYYVSALYEGSDWRANSMPSVKESGARLTPVGIGDEIKVPMEFFLSQNFPNPFNPTTSIFYGLPIDSHVKIEIFNLLGQKVRILIDENQKAGYRRAIWDGLDGRGESLSSGVYLYRLQAGDNIATRKMVMLK